MPVFEFDLNMQFENIRKVKELSKKEIKEIFQRY